MNRYTTCLSWAFRFILCLYGITVRFDFELCRFSFCSKLKKFQKLYSKTVLRIPISVEAFKIFCKPAFR